MSAVVPTKPPAVAFRNVFDLAADYGIHFERSERRGRKGHNDLIQYDRWFGGRGWVAWSCSTAQTIRQWRKSAAGGLRFDVWHHRIYSDRPWPNDFCDVAIHEGPCFRLVLKITINKG